MPTVETDDALTAGKLVVLPQAEELEARPSMDNLPETD